MTSNSHARGHSAGSLLLAALILSAVTLFGSGTVLAQGAQGGKKDDGRGEVILSNLPPKGSPAYKELLRLAGSKAKGQVLSFTKSEVWRIPRTLLAKVKNHCDKTGVNIIRVEADWNQILKPPAALSMTNAQELMLDAIKGAKETKHVGVMSSPDASMVEYALMKDFGVDGSSGPTQAPAKIVIPINETQTVTAIRTASDKRANGCIWRGEIEETGEPVMLMWFKEQQRYTGMFTYRGNIYNLVNMGGGLHAVVESDPSSMPPDHAVAGGATAPGIATLQDDPVASRGEGAILRKGDRANLRDQQDMIRRKSEAAPPGGKGAAPSIAPMPEAQRLALAAKTVVIDVMVLYTPKVAAKYVDVDTDLIGLSIEQANQSFANSGLGNISLRLVHSQEIDYDESGREHFGHLYRMVDGEQPFAGIRRLRNEKRADVVALIVDDPSGCGLSTRVAADADEAYVVVHHSCAALTYSVAHEIGHIIGARHDKNLDPSSTPFPYGHGYVNGTKWRDIMSYRASCNGCPRLPFWSNPTVKVRGEPAGTLDTDNARVLLEQAERVSNFR